MLFELSYYNTFLAFFLSSYGENLQKMLIFDIGAPILSLD